MTADPYLEPCPLCGSMAPREALLDKGGARRRDPDTAHQAALIITERRTTAKSSLLMAFNAAFPEPITDEEAARSAGLSLGSEYATRCSELRKGPNPLLEPVPGEVPLRGFLLEAREPGMLNRWQLGDRCALDLAAICTAYRHADRDPRRMQRRLR